MSAARAGGATADHVGPAPDPLVGEGVPSGRRLLLLAAVAAVLGTITWPVVSARLAPPEEHLGTPVVAFEPSSVSEVGVRRDPVEGRFRRTAGGWTLSLPGVAGDRAIDGELVDGFLRELHGLDRLTQFVEPDLAAFGLAPPSGEVVLVQEGGETRMDLGDRNPPLTALYVQVLPAPDVVLVGSVLQWEFNKLIGIVARESASAGKEAVPADHR